MGRASVRGAAIALVTLLTVTAGCTAQQRTGASSQSLAMSSPSAGSRTPSPVVTSSSTRPSASSASPPTTSTSRTRAIASSAAATREVPRPSSPVALAAGVAQEASGLTPTGDDGTFWTVDDASGTDSLIAIDDRGRRVGSLQVDGMSAGNAEALSVGACTAGSPARCLFVGDLGDHVGRDDVAIYRVPQPTSTVGEHRADGTAWRYTYSDGPRDAESMFVAPDGSLVVIDKPQPLTEAPPRGHHVYRGPPGGGVLTLVGTFTPPTPAQPLQSMIEGNVATDAALQVGPAHTRVVVLFYDQVLQYTAPQRAADPATFFRWPHVSLPNPDLIQAEGIAPLTDGCGFASISEAGPGGSAAQLAVAPCR